jgi:hypothetical protein
MIGEARQENSSAIKKSTRERNDSWTPAIEPQAAEKCRHTEHKNADRKSQRDFGNAPSELLRKRQSKYAPGVNGAQRYLEKHTSNSDTPTTYFHEFSFKVY